MFRQLNLIRFNTQPPEGGWPNGCAAPHCPACFNTQPPEGGWAGYTVKDGASALFQHTAA